MTFAIVPAPVSLAEKIPEPVRRIAEADLQAWNAAVPSLEPSDVKRRGPTGPVMTYHYDVLKRQADGNWTAQTQRWSDRRGKAR